jgi:hypothetical protein
VVYARFAIQAAIIEQFQPAQFTFNLFTNLSIGDNLLSGKFRHIAERHHLNKTYLPGVFQRQSCQIRHIVVIETAHNNRIQLEWRQSGFLRRHDTIPYIGEVSPACNASELCGIERINADVDARHPGFTEWARQSAHQNAVRGHGDGRTPGVAPSHYNVLGRGEWSARRQ